MSLFLKQSLTHGRLVLGSLGVEDGLEHGITPFFARLLLGQGEPLLLLHAINSLSSMTAHDGQKQGR